MLYKMDLSSLPRFNKVTTLEELISNLNTLFLMNGLVPQWEKNVEYTMPVSYVGTTTVLTISKSNITGFSKRNSIRIRIYPIDKPIGDDEYNSCLSIEIAKYGGAYATPILSAYIGWVKVNEKCPIPKHRSGTWLINLSKKFLCILGITSTFLQDAAGIKCRDDYAKLVLLRCFQGKYSSWYEEFGFVPEKDIKKAMKLLHDYPAKNLADELTTAETKDDYILNIVQCNEPCEPYKNNLNERERKNIADILNSHPPTNKNLGEYMSDLWKIDCAKYMSLQYFLLFSTGSWQEYIDAIFSAIGTLDNKSICD